MFVVVQFPIADGRRFADGPPTYLPRPGWAAPQAGVLSEYVWGFGRVTYSSGEVDPAWSDEACYALAAGSLRLPGLTRRLVRLADGAFAIVTCGFRRLLHDGRCVARVEIRLDVTKERRASAPLDAEAVVKYVMSLPSVVPEAGGAARPRPLITQGSRLAARYRDASAPPSMRSGQLLVAAGNPLILVDCTRDENVLLPAQIADASDATAGQIHLGFALTRFGNAGVPTWYLGPSSAANKTRQKLRLCLLRLHAEEEVLDRVVSWVDGGRLSYTAGCDAADRLDSYVDRATQLLERKLNYGLPSSAIRAAYDAATRVSRRDVAARRRAGLEGMRLQIRRKAEKFIARRDAVRPQITVAGDYVSEKVEVRARDLSGVVISRNMQTISSSFNDFAASRSDNEELLTQMKILADSVAALVAVVQTQSLPAAEQISEMFSGFAEESAKEEPRPGKLRELGKSLIDAAAKVAKVAGPIVAAVAAVWQIFGISPL
jgi:hypothetical protein